MNLYDVRDHLLLSEDAKALQPEQIVLLAQAAEDVLGLTGTSYTGAEADRAATAVALQVNRMVATLPRDPFLTSHTIGDESKSWNPGGMTDVPVDPTAQMIVDALAAEAGGGGGDGSTAGAYLVVPGFR